MIVEWQPGYQGKRLPWEDVLRHLEQAPQERLYGLVDGALNEHLLKQIAAYWPAKAHSIYANMPEGNHPEVSPLLIPVDPAANPSAENVFQRLLSSPHTIKPESLLFLWSESPLEELASHLGNHAAITTSKGTRAILRFHDPNIWPAALAVQTDDEQAGFFSRIAEVWCPDLDMMWWHYRRQQAIEPRPFQPVPWTAERHARFTALTRPRKMLLRLEEDHEDEITGSRVDWLKRIGKWLEEAERLGISRQDEQYVYCVTAVFAGERFAQAPEVARELSDIGTRHDSFTKAIEAVPSEVWDRLGSQQSSVRQ